MNFHYILLLVGFAFASKGEYKEDCYCEKGCGPGKEDSFLGYKGFFKGGAQKYVPVYEKHVSYEKDCIVKGGKSHGHGHGYGHEYGDHHQLSKKKHYDDDDHSYRKKRDCEKCKCQKGCGPGFEKSFLGYQGQFKGGAQKYLPVYEKQVSYEKDCIVKGGKSHGYHHGPGYGPGHGYGHENGDHHQLSKKKHYDDDDHSYRKKRDCEKCKCQKGCGPGFEKSFLGYQGQFKGGAQKYLPVYEKQVSYEKDCIVKGGKSHHHGPGYGHGHGYGHEYGDHHQLSKKKHYDDDDHSYRKKRDCDKCECKKGCGPGFEKSFLGYQGQFKGGAQKYLPVYEKQVSYEKDCIVKGGKSHHHFGPIDYKKCEKCESDGY